MLSSKFSAVQGLLATLCATLILVNPIAKLAITMDPVGVAANTWAAGAIHGDAPQPTTLPLADMQRHAKLLFAM